jgi:dTDP-glucose pyrophosphorylase
MGLIANERDTILVEPPVTYGELAGLLTEHNQQYALVRDTDGRYRGVVRHSELETQLRQNPALSSLEVLSADSAVQGPMFYCPALYEDSTPLEIRGLTLRSEMPFMPVLDIRGRLVEVLSSEDALRRGLHDNPVVVMAGGFGVRMRPLTEMMPKPMIPLEPGRLIDRVIDHLVDCGFHRFYLAVHYMKDQLMNYLGDGSSRGISIEYIVEDSPQGTAGSLRRFASRQPNSLPLVVTNGDVVTNLHFNDVLRFHRQQSAGLTLVCKPEGMDISYGVVECDDDGVLTSIIEKPRLTYLINAGMYIVEPDVLNLLPTRSFFMTDLVDEIRKQGGRVCVYQSTEYWRDVGTMEGYAQVIQDIKTGKVKSYPMRR